APPARAGSGGAASGPESNRARPSARCCASTRAGCCTARSTSRRAPPPASTRTNSPPWKPPCRSGASAATGERLAAMAAPTVAARAPLLQVRELRGIVGHAQHRALFVPIAEDYAGAAVGFVHRRPVGVPVDHAVDAVAREGLRHGGRRGVGDRLHRALRLEPALVRLAGRARLLRER